MCFNVHSLGQSLVGKEMGQGAASSPHEGADEEVDSSVALIQGATEHNEEQSMLIYNTHQPSSETHPFNANKKIAFCKHVLRHAITEHSARQNNVGFVFGGDANCIWSAESNIFQMDNEGTAEHSD